MSRAVSNAGVRQRPVDGEAGPVRRSTLLCDHEVSDSIGNFGCIVCCWGQRDGNNSQNVHPGSYLVIPAALITLYTRQG